MKRFSASLVVCLAACGALADQAAAREEKAKGGSAAADVVAVLGETTITDAQLRELARDRLMRLRTEEYQIKRQVLEDYVTRFLLEKEAKARGITVDALQRSEIDAKVLPVTEDQKRAVYESSPPQQFAGKAQAEAFAQIEANLKRIRTTEARNALLNSLRAKTPVRILLEPPRLALETGNAPARGPAGAPVTIVEFSDFQCPACGRAYPTLKRLEQQYPGKLRVVYRHFPLPIHPLAPKAAEASACAGDQGKFWEMHDRMFTNQQRLSVADLKAAASELGLDAAKFGECLDSGRHASLWQADVNEGRKYGVSATPTFFINGRQVSGAQPYQSFSQIVEEELAARVGATDKTRN